MTPLNRTMVIIGTATFVVERYGQQRRTSIPVRISVPAAPGVVASAHLGDDWGMLEILGRPYQLVPFTVRAEDWRDVRGFELIYTEGESLLPITPGNELNWRNSVGKMTDRLEGRGARITGTPPVINVTVEAPALTVNVEPNLTVNLPPQEPPTVVVQVPPDEPKKISIERNRSGLISSATVEAA